MVDLDLPLDSIVATYIKLRTTIEELEEQQKGEMALLKEQFETVAGKLLEICNDQNADSIKTPAGTVSRRITSRYWTSDWSTMHQFILEQEAPFLLEQRIHNGNMKQFLEENPDLFPAGMQADRKFTVQVRKPTSK